MISIKTAHDPDVQRFSFVGGSGEVMHEYWDWYLVRTMNYLPVHNPGANHSV